MLVTRRGFLGAMLALGAAPAIVHAGNLMPLVVRKPVIVVPTFKTFVTPAYARMYGLAPVEWYEGGIRHSATEPGLIMVDVPADQTYDLGTPDPAAYRALVEARKRRAPPAKFARTPGWSENKAEWEEYEVQNYTHSNVAWQRWEKEKLHG